MRSWTALPLLLLLLPACCVAPEDEGECSHEDLCGGRHSAEPVRSGCLLQHNCSQHTVLKLHPEDELHEDAVSTRRIDAAKLHAPDGTLSALAGASGAVGKIGRTSADSDGDARSAGPALVEGAVSAAARRAAEPSAAASETALVSFALPWSLEAGRAHPGDLVLQGLDEFLGLGDPGQLHVEGWAAAIASRLGVA
eukprot:CAMPEP_0183391314 /NCGR_PEP_ID=MMETSP0370-20130417/6350_1 /TAXON_ID=268820 /ORGANISM="Peridinium aciculiferum, Strain PAER-2" /LENGTH=195 /DNA_ID=CAMNT_0025571013 /DNA_START=84 /DNA_END=671 /DNA_ORIENTATION=-